MQFDIKQSEAQSVFGNLRGRNLNIIGEAGRGGFKVVFKVVDNQGNHYALKILDPDETDLNRLQREARAMMILVSPYVPKLFDWGLGQPEPYPFMLEEYIDGQTLSKLMETTLIMPPNQLVPLLDQILQGLKTCADNNIVHRDIKPQNIMLRTTGAPVIIDFGLSRHADMTSLTTTGQFGPGLTVPFAPPEMFDRKLNNGQRIKETADLFSLGIVVYMMLTGKHPFLEGADSAEWINKMLYQVAIPPISIDPQIPETLSNYVMKLIRREKFKRFQSVEVALLKLRELSL